MSEHDHHAFDALRRLDGPAGLGDGAEDRIEAAMLARFDERVVSATKGAEPPIVDLVAEAERRNRHPRRLLIALSSVAASAAVIVGVALVAGRGEPAEPADRPDVTTTIVEDALVAQQLEAFCTNAVGPAREADAGWVPNGVGSEARLVMIVAVEQASEAAARVVPPLSDRWGDFDERLLAAATDARLSTSLGEEGGDAAVAAARDLLFAVGTFAGVDPVPSSCSPPNDAEGS